MKTNTLRAVAVALGVSACTMAQAQSTYTSPAKWNNFRSISDKGQAAKEVAPVAELPAPVADPIASPIASPIVSPKPMTDAAPTNIAPTNTTPIAAGPYMQAMSTSCAPARLPLASYFGSANLLFLTLEEGNGRQIATGLGSDFNTGIVDPEASTGFDISAGRYLDCGRYGLGITYMLWNPSSESQIRVGAPATIRAEMPSYRDISIDAGSGVESVYDIIDGSGAYAGAAGIRVSRDIRFQGLEANLFSFGLMGAGRVAYTNCCNSGSLLGGKYGHGFGLGKGCKGYGGAAGPLTRPCGGRVRVMTSHGFRWFQANDDLEFAYNIDGTVGYQASDLYEHVRVKNNLYGYQFGGRLTYCLNSRWNLNVGGKFGLYGNHAELRHRIGTATAAVYRTGVPTDLIDTKSTDNVVATLGELDLGLGYRLGCAWSIRGGYRLLGMTGVANAVDSVPYNYYSVASSGQVRANDSYVLHGGYVGLEYNW